MKKKLRGGPIIDVDPQIIRWRKRCKKTGFKIPVEYAPSPNPEKKGDKEISQEIDIWNTFLKR